MSGSKSDTLAVLHEAPCDKYMFRDRHERLVRWDAVPKWLQCAFIIDGYRPVGQSYEALTRSLFYLHNETLNVHTHLLGSVFLLAQLPYILTFRMQAAPVLDRVLLLILILFGSLCFILSARFHLYGCHGKATHSCLGRWDYRGIVLFICANYLPAYAIFYRDLPGIVLSSAIVFSIMLGVAGCYAMDWFERHERHTARKLVFASFPLIAIAPTWHFAATSVARGFEPSVVADFVHAIILMYATYGGGFALYAARIPECLSPGTFDFFFQSHQIFHLACVVAAHNWIWAIVRSNEALFPVIP